MKDKVKTGFVLILIWITPYLFAQGYVCAVGGGTENYNDWSDAPYGWMVQMADSGNVLVMHYSRGSDWLENYFKSFGAADASSLVIASRSAANDSANYRRIISADMVFLRGGDQHDYYTTWKGTLVEEALMQLHSSGGVIGGTSAGLAVLGEGVYTAARRSALSQDAIRNPYHTDVTLAGDFLPLVPGVIFDSHFTARGRQGRLAAFTARWQTDYTETFLGVGVDEHTAVCIGPDGMGKVMGAGSVTIFQPAPESRLTCESGKPLFFTDWDVHVLTAGFVFDFNTWQLANAPEDALSLTAIQPETQTPAATVVLVGSDEPEDVLAGVCEEMDQAVLLSGPDADSWRNAVESAGCRVTHEALSADSVRSQTMADRISRFTHVIIAGMTAQQAANWLVPASPLRSLLEALKDNGEATLLFAGEAVQAAGAEIITNLESDADRLLDGKLLLAPGLGWVDAAFMHQGFVYDDYRENRMGGWLWNCFRQRRAVGFLLDEESGLKIQEGKVSSLSDVPVFIADFRQAAWADSSDQKERPTWHPRQSAGLSRGRLHSLPAGSRVWNMETGEWETTSVVAPAPESGKKKTGLQITPDAGGGSFRIGLPGAGEAFLSIYNILGRRVFHRQVLGGECVLWNGHGSWGGRLASGVYIVRAVTRSQTVTARVLLMR